MPAPNDADLKKKDDLLKALQASADKLKKDTVEMKKKYVAADKSLAAEKDE